MKTFYAYQPDQIGARIHMFSSRKLRDEYVTRHPDAKPVRASQVTRLVRPNKTRGALFIRFGEIDPR